MSRYSTLRDTIIHIHIGTTCVICGEADHGVWASSLEELLKYVNDYDGCASSKGIRYWACDSPEATVMTIHDL